MGQFPNLFSIILLASQSGWPVSQTKHSVTKQAVLLLLIKLSQGVKKPQVNRCSRTCHAEQILQTLHSYRRAGFFTDVVLALEGQDFPCHRATLSASSASFQAVFAGGLKEGYQDTVNLREISAVPMSLVLDYMYGGDIVIEENNVEGLLELSDRLQIPSLCGLLGRSAPPLQLFGRREIR